MASHWSDQNIAATLNRMGLPTGQGKTWTAHRVRSIRRVRDIHAYKSAEKDGTWLTLREAAQRRGVTSHRIRKLIKAGILPAEQVVRGAPFQIRAVDLDTPSVVAAVGRKGRPCHIAAAINFQCFQILEEEVHNDLRVGIPRIARSAALFVRQIRPSSRNPINAGQR